MGRQQQSTGAEGKPVQRLRGLAWPLIALLVVIAAVSIWAAVEAGAAYLDLARYGPVSEDSEQVTPLVGALHLLALPAGLLFIVWFHRAYRNLARYGYRLRHRPTIAIWSWLIPVGNLFAPKQIANEIWRG